MPLHCHPAAELRYYHYWGWGAVEGTPGNWGGAQAADWASCSYHSAPWSWLAAAAVGCCYCPVTVKSRQSAGKNPHPDGLPTGRTAGGGTLGPGHRNPQSRWRLLLLPPPAPGRRSSHRKALKSYRNMLSSAFLREVAASSCAPVLVETHCRKTIWYRESRDSVSPTVPCNLTGRFSLIFWCFDGRKRPPDSS